MAIKDIANQIKQQHPLPHNDKFTFRLAVVILGLVIIAVVAMIGFKYINTNQGVRLEIPEILVALASTALGALAGLLSPALGTRQQ